MTRGQEIRELFAFNSWASRRMFEATAALNEQEFRRDLGNSFPSVRDTLMHIVGAEWVWLSRWQGSSPAALPDDDLSHEQIVRWWTHIDVERRIFLDQVGDGIDRVIRYVNFAGIEFNFPLWKMLRHQVNHSTYHRGQITTMVKQLGHAPVATDMILMYQEQEKELRA